MRFPTPLRHGPTSLAFALALTAAPAAPGGSPPPEATLTLAAAQERALAQNAGWQAMLEELRAAEARVAQAEAGGKLQVTGRPVLYYTSAIPSFRVPALSVPTAPGGSVPGPTFELGTRENVRAELIVEQILWGGPTHANIERARRALHAAQLRSERTRQELLYQVEEGYLQAAVAAENVAVAREELRARTAHRQVAMTRFDTGLAPRYDIVRAEAEIAGAEEQETRVSNAYDLALGRLALVVGDPPERAYRLALPPPETSAPPSLATLQERAAAQRPDLAALDAERQAAEALARAARAERRPVVSLRAELRGNAKDQPLEPSGATAALVGAWSLSDGGRSRALEAEADAQARARDLQREQLRRVVALEVREAFLSIENARRRLATVERQIAQAESALDIAQARYEVGTGVAVEISDSEAALSAARFARLQARLDYGLAAARLRLALGEPAGADAQGKSQKAKGTGQK